MATRSGAGTGVIVALVVFVITTVCLLVLTIVFYSQKTDALASEAQAQADLDRYVTREQRGREEIKTIEGAASGARKSVVAFLQDRYGDLAAAVSGNRTASLEQVRSDLGVGDADVVRNVLSDTRRQLQARSNEVSSLTTRLEDQSRQIESLNAQIAQLQKENEALVGGIDQTVGDYAQAVRDAEEGYRRNLAVADETKVRIEDDWQGRFASAQQDADRLRADNALMTERVRQLQQVVDAIRIKPRNPAELVDGRIVDVGTDDQVFIDIGSRDRVVLGMTFEVYEDSNSIQVDPATGAEVRGKASIQVVKVGETTSIAKITRSSPGRPVVKGNVIANAVYDPEYRFRFLVHGKFDVNNSGRPNEAGAEYVRSLVLDWGGVLIEGDELTGDLDFLVLGEQPPLPPPLPPNADVDQLNRFIELRAARDRYDSLFRQAREAQIPVLNWNRFQVLTGITER